MKTCSYQLCARHQLVGFSRLGDLPLDQVEELERELVLLVIQGRVQVSGGQQLVKELEHRHRHAIDLQQHQKFIDKPKFNYLCSAALHTE